MELYGSLSNISGSVSASYFTGSYIGDGAGLYNLPASGVTGLNLSQIASGSVTASVTPDGFNVNTSTSITGSLNVSGTVLSQTTPLVSGSSQINITGTTGYSAFSSSIATTDSNQESRLNLIETSTGSLNSFTSSINTTIKNKLDADGVISGSSQILNNSGIVSSSTQVTTYGFATTGSNLFIGTQTHSGSILPSVDNAYDLGSAAYQWRDVYISSGSLYIDGTKVIGSTAQELTITTDTGQSIKILEGTTDSIILQTADGDIELKSSADGDILLDPTNGKIMLKGPIEILNGQKIQSSVGGTPVVFANDIVVSGSIDITGTIEGINLTDFSSSLNARLGTLETSTGSLNSFTSSTNSRLSSIETSTSSLNSYTSSNNTRLNTIESTTGSLNSYTSSTNTKLSSIETTTSSIINVNTAQNNRLDSLETTSGSILSTNTAQSSRLDSIEGKTGSYATTGSNIFQGTQTITGSLYISQDLIVAGSSSIQNISSSIVNIADNIITVNALNPSVRFGGLAVIDSGSNPQVSGSMLFDSVNNQWIFVHQNQGTVTSSVLLMGPETYDNLGNEAYITTNRLVKSTGIEHLADSNITDTGTKVSINSNTEITGSLISTANVTSNANLVSNYSVGDEGGEINLNKPVTNTTLNSGITIDVWRDRVRIFESGGTNRGGYFDIAGLSTGASTNLMGTAATASYVEYTNVANKPALVSGSSQISFNSISDKPTLVSGSSQITYGSISGVPSGIVSGSSQVSFNGITDKPTLVSGSSQITYGSISGIPGGIVSGSAQVDLTNTTNYSSGIKTRLNAEGVISGSSQVTGIGNAQLTNSSFYVGTTSISLGRASASQTLTGVSIDGNAATATSATSASSATNSTNAGYLGTTDLRTIAPNSHDAYKLKFGFTSFNNNNTSPWADYLHLRSYSDNSGGSDNLVMFSKSGIGMRIWQQTFGSATAYSSYKDIAFTDGSNASGTWGISISGNAATVGNFTPSQTSGTANRIVVADANGYIINNYFTASGGGSERNTSGMGYFAGHNSSDYYYRSYTAAAAAALLSGQAMNISGTATNITQYTINQNVGTGNAPTFAGGTINGSLYVNASNDVTSLAGSLTLYSSGNATTSMIMFKNTTGLGYGNHGGTSDTYNTYFVMDTTNRGWIFRNATTSANVASISNTGIIAANSDVRTGGLYLRTAAGKGWLSGGYGTYEDSTTTGAIYSIGGSYYPTSTSFNNMHGVGYTHTNSNLLPTGPGTNGWGFYVLTNGTPNVWLGAEGPSWFAYNINPKTNGGASLGNTSYRWANVYTQDLHLSNEGKEGGNEIDGTTGNWTIQEGEENLYIINNKNGKKFKIDLTEIV